jgi:hypothetical protein
MKMCSVQSELKFEKALNKEWSERWEYMSMWIYHECTV